MLTFHSGGFFVLGLKAIFSTTKNIENNYLYLTKLYVFMRLHPYLISFTMYSMVSFSQDKPYQQYAIDADLEQCHAVLENQTTAGMIECEYTARIAWDKQMNKYYKLLIEVLKPAEKKLLRDSQRTWLEYRDNEMNFATAFYKNMEGTAWLVIHAGRLTTIVKQRALELEGYYEMATFDPD